MPVFSGKLCNTLKATATTTVEHESSKIANFHIQMTMMTMLNKQSKQNGMWYETECDKIFTHVYTLEMITNCRFFVKCLIMLPSLYLLSAAVLYHGKYKLILYKFSSYFPHILLYFILDTELLIRKKRSGVSAWQSSWRLLSQKVVPFDD